MTLVTAVALLADFLFGLRWIQRRTFTMLKAEQGPPPIILCLVMGAYYGLPLLLAPILGLTDWNLFWVGLYAASSVVMTIGCWTVFRMVGRRYQ